MGTLSPELSTSNKLGGGGESWVWTLGTDMSIDVSNNDLHGRIDAYSRTGCSLRVANNRFTEHPVRL